MRLFSIKRLGWGECIGIPLVNQTSKTSVLAVPVIPVAFNRIQRSGRKHVPRERAFGGCSFPGDDRRVSQLWAGMSIGPPAPSTGWSVRICCAVLRDSGAHIQFADGEEQSSHTRCMM